MAKSAAVTIARSPVGIPIFWESGMEPPVKWPIWAATLKLTIMAKNSINVDFLKPEIKDLTYSAEPTYETPTENETQAQHKERDLRNNKRKVDWDNECKQIAFKGPIVDGFPWDEADLKVRSLIYLSLGTEGHWIYQQRFPRSDIERITVFELAHELSISFTQPRNITYDCFLLFTCKQKQKEKLESFHCRLKALGAKCRLWTAEEDLIKEISIAFMTNTDKQRELLMETRTSSATIRTQPWTWSGKPKSDQHTNKSQPPKHIRTNLQHNAKPSIQPTTPLPRSEPPTTTQLQYP